MEALNLSKRQTFGYKGQLFMLDLSYIGWSILAGIPTLFYNASFFQESYQAASDFVVGTISFIPEAASAVVLPAIVWTLIMGVWDLVVSIFYYLNYICVELGYFETAKRTSGTASRSSYNPWQNGPDNMGGF